MVFEFTAAEWASAALQADIEAYADFVDAQTAGSTTEAGGTLYDFTELGLSAGGMEVVEVYVDDVLVTI
jgi:hypothetical protein